MELDGSTPLSVAAALLKNQMEEGTECPCCGQLAKIYRRKINSAMAYGMILFFKKFGWDKRWVHVPSETGLSRLGGDWAKLALWGLIEERASDRDDSGPHAGWWRITDRGVGWVVGRVCVPKSVYIYNGNVLRFDQDESVGIRDALRDRFNYAELMLGVVLPPEDGQMSLF